MLRVFAFDPMSSRLGGGVLHIDVPFERGLAPGPLGSLVQVVDYDATRAVWYQPLDLDDPAVLAADGLAPSERDPRSHQQSVYAVASSVIETFERHLGRRFAWRGGRQLRLVPHAFQGRNAYFDPTRRAVLFGYFPADAGDPGANLPGQVIFTALSVDVVAHEVTHAIVHRLREHLSEPTNPDVLAWHEACADLVALFHHFVFPEVVAGAVARSRGDLGEGSALTELAAQFGAATGRGRALRAAIDPANPADPAAIQSAREPHERGAVFVAGVFDAFVETFRSSVADLQRLATGGTGVLPAGALPPDLVARVSKEAVLNADRLLGMVVRAFEFLPVVDVTFGDVLRAVVTADRFLHPDDGLRLRSRLVESMRRRGIYPASVSSLAEDTLTWPAPVTPLNLHDGPAPVDIASLVLAATLGLDAAGVVADLEDGPDEDSADVAGEEATPETPPAPHEPSPGPVALPDSDVAGPIPTGAALRMWATAHAHELGLDPGSPIRVDGVHVSYLQAADRQPRPVVVVQLVQRRADLEDSSVPSAGRMRIRAGTTVIAHPDGRVEHLVLKPLPLPDPRVLADLPEPVAAWVRANHTWGQRRLEAVRAFVDRIDSGDPVSAWTTNTAVSRLTFARLHFAEGAASAGGPA